MISPLEQKADDKYIDYVYPINKELREKIVKDVSIIMNDYFMVFTEDEVKALDDLVIADTEYNLKQEEKERLREEKELLREKKLFQKKLEKAKNDEKTSIAKLLLKEKASPEMVRRVTGLSMDKIKSIML